MDGHKAYPVALTIAGSDSGGGAGIQADLKTFAANSVFGTSAITCITAQNPDRVSGIQEISPDMVEAQILAVLDFFVVGCIKTGMLFSEKIISTVCKTLSQRKIKIVVDPVMVSTSGAKLLNDDAIISLEQNLIPLSCLITPNLDEASVFLNEKISDITEMKDAVHSLFSKFRIPILLKGGHLLSSEFAVDLFYDGKSLIEFSKPFLRNFNSHGTGCTYSSAIASGIAKGLTVEKSVAHAKEYLHKTIEQSFYPAKTSSLNHYPAI